MVIQRDIFDELFVLELANNHWGDLNRGLRIVRDFGAVVRYNNVRAAIKLQFRDVDSFIHREFRNRDDIRYIRKTMETQLTRDDFAKLVDAIRRVGCIPMATPFDERSVDLCMELNIDIIKVASSDIADWVLLEKIATARRPVIVSTGGSSLKDIDDIVTFFENRQIPLAINHCISIYPSEDHHLQLNQIDFLKNRYPSLTIGLSTHEYTDWTSSILVAYAKGARTFERHIDIQTDDRPFAPYCSTPQQIDTWFKAFKKVKLMCGQPGTQRHQSEAEEIKYLDALVRGVYAARTLEPGMPLRPGDYYLAIPLQKGQLSCREIIEGFPLLTRKEPHAPLMLDCLDTPYASDPALRSLIDNRGL